MYYIIEKNWVGPATPGSNTEDVVLIRKTIPKVMATGEVRTDGWLGTAKDWAHYSHGGYATLEEAEKATREVFGKVTEITDMVINEEYVKAYRPGPFKKYSEYETEVWVKDRMDQYLDVNSDQDDIEEVAKLFRESAGESRIELHPNLEGIIKGLIDEAIEDSKYDN